MIIIYLLICIGLLAIGVPAIGVAFVFFLLILETFKQMGGNTTSPRVESRKQVWARENEDEDEYYDLGY